MPCGHVMDRGYDREKEELISIPFGSGSRFGDYFKYHLHLSGFGFGFLFVGSKTPTRGVAGR